MTVPLARLYTSYAAIEMRLPPASLGLLSSAFALLPILLAFRIGGRIDRKGERLISVLGALVVLFSVIGLAFFASDLLLFVLFTATLGVGHLMAISAMQMVVTRCSTSDQVDTVLGYFLLATGAGQAVGPLIVTIATPQDALTPGPMLPWAILGTGILLALAAIVMATRIPPHRAEKTSGVSSVRSLLGARGLILVIIASSLTVTAGDLTVVFLPALGDERGIGAGLVGIMLSVRALFLMSSRLIYARLVRRLGRTKLLWVSVLVSGAALSLLVLDVSVWGIAALVGVAGFAAGLATAASMSLAIVMAPAGMRGTTVSLRLTANRIGQVAIPIAAGGVTVFAGVAGVFPAMGLAMIVAAIPIAHMKDP